MIDPFVLSENQREALQEIANIGMGKAGRSIASVFNEFVELSIPRVKVIAAELLPAAIAELVPVCEVTAVRQAFFGKLRGEAIVVFEAKGCGELADLMGYDITLTSEEEQEILLDVSNVVVGTCLGGIAEQLHVSMSFSAPSVLAHHVAPQGVIVISENSAFSAALLVEVNFKLERRNFGCSLIALMPQSEIAEVKAALNKFLEAL